MGDMSITELIKGIKKLPPTKRSAFDRQYRRLLDVEFKRESQKARKQFPNMADDQIDEMVNGWIHEMRYGRK